MKRYIFKVKYQDKVIDKIDIEVTQKNCIEQQLLFEETEDFAIQEANVVALNNLQVELEEVIDE